MHKFKFGLMKKLFIFCFLLFPLFTFSQEKINGISIVAPSKNNNYPSFNEVKDLGANWITVMPYSFVDEQTGEVKFNHEWQWWGEKTKGVVAAIVAAKKQNLKIMVKPMLWLKGGGYTGDLQFSQLPNWEVFEKSYGAYLNHFAKISDSLKVELFCIGTEMKSFTQFKADFFPTTIKTYRDSFQFELTYAANWDNYKNINFWNHLDYIGIDAYFPGAAQNQPTIQQAKIALVKTKYELKDFAETKNLKILFTEYGYRSCTQCAFKPWEHKNEVTPDNSCQKNALEAFYAQLYNQTWCIGGFLWKWNDYESEFPKNINTDYSPQGKPALETIKQNF